MFPKRLPRYQTKRAMIINPNMDITGKSGILISRKLIVLGQHHSLSFFGGKRVSLFDKKHHSDHVPTLVM